MSTPDRSWFEDFQVGDTFRTAGRTVTETDLVNFSGLSGDFNSIHVDAEFSKNGPFGRRVAHGFLVVSIASGLIAQAGMLQGIQGGLREIKRWRFISPVFIGDTIKVEIEIIELRPMARAGGGLVSWSLRINNQNQDTVMKGIWSAFVLSKPSD